MKPGDRYGLLEAVERTDKRHLKSIVWIFKCHGCGSTAERSVNIVRISEKKKCITSCGCMGSGRSAKGKGLGRGSRGGYIPGDMF